VETKFLGNIQQWLYAKGDKFTVVNGKLIGTKSTKGKQILLEDLMSENYLDLDPEAYGVYIPADEVLARPKYQWLAHLSSQEVLKTNAIIVKYLKSSEANEYFTDHTIQSVATI
jgi:hypothetical protein